MRDSCWTDSFFYGKCEQYLQVIVEIIGEIDMDSEKRGASVRQSFWRVREQTEEGQNEAVGGVDCRETYGCEFVGHKLE